MRIAVLGGRYLIALLLAACGLERGAAVPHGTHDMMKADGPAPADRDALQAQALAQLAQSSGVPWRARYRPGRLTVSTLEPLAPPPPLTLPRGGSSNPKDAAARSWLLSILPLLGLSGSADLRLLEGRDDQLGHRHIRFRQQRNGVAVHQASLWVHLDQRGALTGVHAATAPLTPDWAPSFPLAEANAAQAALRYAAGATPWPAPLRASAPQRVLVWSDAQMFSAYRVDVEGQGQLLPLRRQLLIDAQQGVVLRDDDRLATLDAPRSVTAQAQGALLDMRTLSISAQQDAQGTNYQLVDLARGGARTVSWGELHTPYGLGGQPTGTAATRPIESRDPGRWDQDREAGAGSAVDAHAHLATVFDYFAREHGRLGPAGDAQGATAVVHYQLPGEGTRSSSAFYDGHVLGFGDGDGVAVRPLAAALDVVAHEYVHALLDNEVGLRQEGEAGAIAEGIANLFACLIERTADPAAAWTIGERVYRFTEAGRVIADLEDPARSDQAVERAALGAPPAGVAPRSFDPAHEAAVAAWRRRGAGLIGLIGQRTAQRFGDQRAGALWYRLVTTYLHESAEFSDVADGLVAAARDLGYLGPGDAEAEPWFQRLFAMLGVETLATAGVSAMPR